MPKQATDNLLHIELENLTVNPDFNMRYARPDPDVMRELKLSIREYGILQPVIVTKGKDGKYSLIAGFMRTQACLELKRKTIPVTVIDDSKKSTHMCINFIENNQRQELSIPETARAVYNVFKQTNLTQEQAAKEMGISRSSATNHINMVKRLHPKIMESWLGSPKSGLELKLMRTLAMKPHAEQLLEWKAHVDGPSPESTSNGESPRKGKPSKRGLNRAKLMAFRGRLTDGAYGQMVPDWVDGALMAIDVALGTVEIPPEKEAPATQTTTDASAAS